MSEVDCTATCAFGCERRAVRTSDWHSPSIANVVANCCKKLATLIFTKYKYIKYLTYVVRRRIIEREARFPQGRTPHVDSSSF